MSYDGGPEIELLKIDNKWIPVGNNKSLYIRPFFISTSEFIRATPSNDYMFAIITSPCSNYYSGEVNLKIEERYSRAVPGGVGPITVCMLLNNLVK